MIEHKIRLDTHSPTGLAWVLTGEPALTNNAHGYYQGTINNVRYLAHRVVFYLHKGQWPRGVLDHIDGNGLNNSIDNLRDVTYTENNQNRVARGYRLHRDGKYEARISANKISYNLGLFEDAESARLAYLEAKRVLHPSAPARCYATEHPK